MAFSEKLKKEVRAKSDGRCVICHKPFVEIHHIKPQKDSGDDTIDNAVALCAYCHDLIGDNPTKRKQLVELRDSWYKIVEANKSPKIIEKHYFHENYKFLTPKDKTKIEDDKLAAIYHVVYKNENFEDAAKALLDLTRKAQDIAPNKRRALYLDIDGHRLENGAFDSDMWELQFYFILQNLLWYYTEIHIPLVTFYNPYKQIEDPVPKEIIIFDEHNTPEALKGHEGSIVYTFKKENYLLDENETTTYNIKYIF